MPALIKIILYVLFVVALFVVRSPEIFALLTPALLIVLLLTVPVRLAGRGWVPISILLIFTFLSNLFFHPGKVVFHPGPLVITEEGVTAATVRTLRVLLMIMGAKIVIATTSAELLVASLGRIFRPLERFGLPVGEFFSTMGLVMKSLPKLRQEISAACRKEMENGKDEGFWNRIKTVAGVCSALFVGGLESPEKFLNDTPEDTRND